MRRSKTIFLLAALAGIFVLAAGFNKNLNKSQQVIQTLNDVQSRALSETACPVNCWKMLGELCFYYVTCPNNPVPVYTMGKKETCQYVPNCDIDQCLSGDETTCQAEYDPCQ
jgi:hypothetical protein